MSTIVEQAWYFHHKVLYMKPLAPASTKYFKETLQALDCKNPVSQVILKVISVKSQFHLLNTYQLVDKEYTYST